MATSKITPQLGHFATVEMSFMKQDGQVGINATTAIRPDVRDDDDIMHMVGHAVSEWAEEMSPSYAEEMRTQYELAAEANAMHGVVKNLPVEKKQRYASRAIYGIITLILAFAIAVTGLFALSDVLTPVIIGWGALLFIMDFVGLYLLGVFDGLIFVVQVATRRARD